MRTATDNGKEAFFFATPCFCEAAEFWRGLREVGNSDSTADTLLLRIELLEEMPTDPVYWKSQSALE